MSILTHVSSVPDQRHSSFTSPFMMLSQRRACRLSPLVPTRCHYHRLRFSGRTYCADILWTPRARPFGALCILDSACSYVVCKLGSCCVHSSAPQFDRSLREGAPCATLSMLTYYRTSRSSHVPFWAVCSLSGAQPEIWSVGWNPPVHRIAFRFKLFVAFPSIHVLRRQPRRRARGPRAPLARSTRAEAAQRGSEDVDVRSRLRPDALPYRRFVFGHIVDFMHAFATPSRELRLA